MNAVASPQSPSVTPRSHGGPLRVALIGSGKMGVQHLRAIRGIQGATLVAIADPLAVREQLQELTTPDTQFFADAATMLQQAKPDVVHIVTPPASHAELALAVLRAGCHLYVEKPFTPTLAEAEAVMTVARERGLLVCAGHQCLAEEANVESLKALPAIGELVHVESVLAFRTVRRSITPVDQAKDILPHAVYPVVDQLRAATGLREPITVHAVRARAEGDVYAMLSLGQTTALITLTLNGRPVEQYQQLIGTNGSLRADYIIGGVIRLEGPGSGLGVLFTPYRRAWQTFKRATSGFGRLVFGKAGSYRGLHTLVRDFYDSIRTGAPPPIAPESILETVAICERIGQALDDAEERAEQAARERLSAATAALRPLPAGAQTVLVTGGTGFLGRGVLEELRHAGFGVRTLVRRMPRYADRVAGVDYVRGDLAQPLDDGLLIGVSLVAHCAAETSGGQLEHQRNSVQATRHVLEAAARNGVKRVIHVSSLAVLKSTGRPLDESSPIDSDNPARGPYVWGKAVSEQIARDIAAAHDMTLRIIRPGPLVDYRHFHPPGRLGRELGPWFVAIGGRKSELSVCDVMSAARVIRSYAQDLAAAPDLVNLVESPPPTRAELAARYRAGRPDLSFIWVPGLLLRALSPLATFGQRFVLGSKKPVDVYAAFSSERYRTERAAAVLARAGTGGTAGTSNP